MSPKTLHIIRQLREDGMTMPAIGRAFGLSKQRVAQVLTGSPKPPLYLTAEEIEARAARWQRNYYMRRCRRAAKRVTTI